MPSTLPDFRQEPGVSIAFGNCAPQRHRKSMHLRRQGDGIRSADCDPMELGRSLARSADALRRHLLGLLVCAVALIAIRAYAAMGVIELGPHLASGRVPPIWHVKQHSGKADIAGCTENGGACVHFISRNSSFALERSMDVNPADLPLLCWRWKVTRLPEAGDLRNRATDDQAAQLLVAFDDRRVLSYIWDSNAPKGTMRSVSVIPLVHVFAVVCESGPSELNQWVSETRNVAADYERAFGKPAPLIKGLRLQINTQHTGGNAESYFGQIALRSAPE